VDSGADVADERHAKWPTKLHRHNINPNNFSLRPSVNLATIRARALAQSPFERKLQAKGGALKECIISDTAGKQQFALLPIDAALCVVSGSSAVPGRPGSFETADRSEAGPIPKACPQIGKA